jgi:hypothetical protein
MDGEGPDETGRAPGVDEEYLPDEDPRESTRPFIIFAIFAISLAALLAVAGILSATVFH